MKYIITAYTNYTIIKINNLLKNENIPCKMISTPRELSSDCGMSIKFETDKKKYISDLVESLKESIENIYIKKNNKYLILGG